MVDKTDGIGGPVGPSLIPLKDHVDLERQKLVKESEDTLRYAEMLPANVKFVRDEKGEMQTLIKEFNSEDVTIFYYNARRNRCSFKPFKNQRSNHVSVFIKGISNLIIKRVHPGVVDYSRCDIMKIIVEYCLVDPTTPIPQKFNSAKELLDTVIGNGEWVEFPEGE